MQIVRENGLRDLLLNKKKRATPEKFMVIIKPGRDSDFQTLFGILDETSISDVKHYAMADVDPVEYSLVQER